MRMPDARASTLGDECVVVGAIDYAVDHLGHELFTSDAPFTPRR
jgi:hypothetical protein